MAANNPAGQILEHLTEAQRHPPGAEAIDVWREVFGFRDKSMQGDLRIMTHGAELLDMTNDVREQMAALPPQFHATELLAPFGAVEDTLARFRDLPSMSLEQFFQPLTPDGWHCLRMANHFLSNEAGESPIDSSAREDLLTKIWEVQNHVIDSEEFDPATKRILLKRLRDLEDAVIEVRLRGVDDIEAATDSIVSLIFRRFDLGVTWMRTQPTGQLFAGLILLIGAQLGVNEEYLALPGLGESASIEAPSTSTTVDVDVDVQLVPAEAEDVVDGEVVTDAGPEPM